MSGEKCSGETITQVTYPVDPARANIQIIKFTFPHKDSACFKTAGADPKLLKKNLLASAFHFGGHPFYIASVSGERTSLLWLILEHKLEDFIGNAMDAGATELTIQLSTKEGSVFDKAQVSQVIMEDNGSVFLKPDGSARFARVTHYDPRAVNSTKPYVSGTDVGGHGKALPMVHSFLFSEKAREAGNTGSFTIGTVNTEGPYGARLVLEGNLFGLTKNDFDQLINPDYKDLPGRASASDLAMSTSPSSVSAGAGSGAGAGSASRSPDSTSPPVRSPLLQARKSPLVFAGKHRPAGLSLTLEADINDTATPAKPPI